MKTSRKNYKKLQINMNCKLKNLNKSNKLNSSHNRQIDDLTEDYEKKIKALIEKNK